MFLKSLKIEGNEGLIREIEFKKGVNLIVDNSSGEDKSGNNVGKTTIIRLIDYCLGGKGENIFRDPEFKTVSAVKDFLINKEVVLTLVLAESPNVPSYRTITIERNFLPRSAAILRIDGEQYSMTGKNKFSQELTRRIFDCDESKPTFRQIIAKNIRDEKDRLNNVLKVLHPTTTAVEYEALYQFWLGVHTDEGDAHQKIRERIRKQESYRSQLANEFDVTEFSIIEDLQQSINELKKKKSELDLEDEFQVQLDAFDQLKAELTRIATQLSGVHLRRQLIEDSARSLERDISRVSSEEIKRLYEEAKVLLPTLQRSFDESLAFHNEMVKNKLAYITKELPALLGEERTLKRKVNELEAQANEFKALFQKEQTLEALERINTDLQSQIVRHAKLSEQKRIWESCIAEIDRLKTQAGDYAEKSKSLNEQIDDNLERFNRILKRISTELYGEHYKLVRRTVDNAGKQLEFLQFELRGVTSNPGTGEKKGQITAFDLAYIEYAEEMEIPHLNFILHDQIENVDGRQIVTILEKLVPTINCQYIAPILRDKVPPEIDLEKYSIIELSKDEKLFKF
jgi:uncharacterized protein YydD (DUF2326 family)